MSLQKQPEYDKGLFMYRLLSNEAPEYISNQYTTVGTITLVRLDQG